LFIYPGTWILKRSTYLGFIALCALAGWHVSHPNAWKALRPQSPEPNAEVAAATPSQTQQNALPTAATNTSPLLSTAVERPQPAKHGQLGGQACALPTTGALTTSSTPDIYRWTDAQGQLHFGDKPAAANHAEAYTPPQSERVEYFNLAIEYRGEISAPYFRNQLTTQVNGIYQILSGLLGQQRLRKVDLNIALYPDRESYLHYADQTAGHSMSNTGGFYSSKLNEAVTYIYPSPHHTLEVAKHESTHVIAAGVLGVTPLWLNEGMAEYFSLLGITGLYKEITPHSTWLDLARQSVASGYPHNLAALLSLDSTSWHNANEANHYAVSWALVYFLMSSKEGKASVANLLHQLADHYCQPIDSVALLNGSYSGGMAQLQEDFYEWLGDADRTKAHYY
jgi:hypothetical protein